LIPDLSWTKDPEKKNSFGINKAKTRMNFLFNPQTDPKEKSYDFEDIETGEIEEEEWPDHGDLVLFI
jgi:hypothetical protein